MRGEPERWPLPTATLRITLGNFVHAGAEVDGPRGHVRVFAYVRCVAKGAPLHAIMARMVVDADGRPVPNFAADAARRRGAHARRWAVLAAP